MPETLTAWLRRQHGVFRGLLDEMEEAVKAPGGDPKVEELLSRLLPMLAGHERVERELLFPAILKHVKPADPRLIGLFQEAHEQVHEKTDALRAALSDRRAAFGRLVAAADLIALLREHLEEEEAALFPLADAHVPAETLRELAARAGKTAEEPGGSGRRR